MSGNGLSRLFQLSAPDMRGEGALAWMEQGACVGKDPELFFPTSPEEVQAAKKVCAGCDVRSQCLLYALENRVQYGFWGGASETQRRSMDRRGERLTPVRHGTEAGFQRGCRDRERCPGNARGMKCQDAHHRSVLMRGKPRSRGEAS